MSEADEIVKRIQGHKGVLGVIIVNSEGIALRSTLDNSTTVQYSSIFLQLCDKAKNTVRELDPQNELCFLRIRTRKNEIMISPSSSYTGTGIADRDYFLICIQTVSEKN